MNSAVVGNLKVLLSLDTSNYDKGVTASEQNTKKLADRLAKDLIPNQQKINALVRDFTGNRQITAALQYATAIEQVGGAAKLTADHQAKANRAAMEALNVYKAMGVAAPKAINDLAVSTAKLNTETVKLEKTSKQTTDSLATGFSKAQTIAGAFGVTLGAGAIVGFARSTFDAADKIGDLALKMGVSTEAAQRFQFAARQSGADIEDVSQAIVQMNNRLAEGDKSTVSALEAAGLQFQTIRGMKPEEAFRAIADAVGRIEDPMEQARVAMDLFGKSGANLLPMIRENSLKVADGVEVMADETVKSLKDAKQSWENFFNWLIIRSGNTIATVNSTFKNVKVAATGDFENIDTGIRTRPKVGDFFSDPMAAMWQVADYNLWRALQPFAERSEKTRGMLASFAGTGDSVDQAGAPSWVSGQVGKTPKKFETKEEREARERAEKERREKEQRAEEEHAKRIKSIRDDYTGEDTKRRIKDLDEALRGLKPEHIDDWSRLNAELNAMVKAGAKLEPTLESLRRSFDLPLAPTPWAALMSGAMPFPQQPAAMGNVVFRPAALMSDNTRELMRLFQPAGTKPTAGAMSTLFSGFGAQLPETILNAITGGGNIGQSIGSLFGRDLGQSIIGKSSDGLFGSGLGKMLQSSFGKNIGGAIANFIPGIGALLGPALSKVFDFLGGIGANKTLKGRQEFAKQLGFESLDNLHNKLISLGAEGAKLANVSTSIIGRKDEAANRKWMADVTKFFDRLEKVPGKVAELSSALGKFGGLIPQSANGILDAILGSGALSADLRKQLEGMQKPTWQAAAELAQSFGINPTALGGAFNQARVADSAFQLKRALDVFAKFEGNDRSGILRDMADEFSALAQEAQKNNVALPRAVQAFIREVDAMGLLVDENGQRIDYALLRFADIEDEAEKQIVDLLTQIRDLLSPQAPGVPGRPRTPGAPEVGVAVPRVGTPVAGAVDGFGGELNMLPGFAGGTHGQYMDFGAGTPVMLHGSERIMTAAEGRSGGGGQMMTVIVQADGRDLTRIVMPYVAGEVKRLGLVRS